MTCRRYTLREDQWDRLKDLLPGREGHVGGTAKDNRSFVEAVLYRYALQVSRGETYPNGLGTSEWYTRAWVAG